MTEYIKRSDALDASKIVYIEYIEIDGDGYEDGDADEIPVVFKRDIEAIPAADVAPVVHGRWIDRPSKRGYGMSTYCSRCGQHSGIGGIESNRHRAYCPNCGARMMEEENNGRI